MKSFTGHARALLLPALMLIGLSACGSEEERQPTAAEVQKYTRKIEQAEAAARAKQIEAARAKEEAVAEKHLERVPAQN